MCSVSVVAYADFGSQTGQALTYLTEGLDDAGHLSRVYCRGVEESAPSVERAVSPIPLGRMVPRALTGVGRLTNGRFNDRVYSEALFDLFAARAIDEVPIHLHYTPGYLRTFQRGRKSGKRLVVRASTEFAESAMQRLARERRRLDLRHNVPRSERWKIAKRTQTLREADEVIAISSFAKDSLVKGGISEEKICVASLGVDFDSYPISTRDPSSTFTVLYVGSVSVNKGIPYLLDAWCNNDWETDEDVKLVLCGGVSPEVRSLIEESGIKNIETPGVVAPREYYRRASVFAFPSLSDGFGKAPLEALAAGLPVVSTDHTGMPDVMTDGEEGFIVPAGDADQLAAKLRYLRENPSIRQRMKGKCLETAKRWSWEKHAEQVIDCLMDFCRT